MSCAWRTPCANSPSTPEVSQSHTSHPFPHPHSNCPCLHVCLCVCVAVRQNAGTPRVRYEASTAPLPGATTVWNTGKGGVKTAASEAKKRTAAVQPTLDRYLVKKKTAVAVGER